MVQPSFVEGGSMAIIESLAVSTPIIAFEGVGVANEFDHGVVRVPFGREDVFITRLLDTWQFGYYKGMWRDPDVLGKMRKQVESFTHESFVKQHDKIWTNLIK